MESLVFRKAVSQPPKPYPLDWLLRFAQSIFLTAILSFTLAAVCILTVALIPLGLMWLPGLYTFSTGVTGAVMHILSVFGGGEWWSGVLMIALTVSGVSVLFDAFVFLQNHGQEAWRAWHGVE